MSVEGGVVRAQEYRAWALLERTEKLERYVGMLRCLSKGQLVVVALLLDGLNGEEIAELLGVTKSAVYCRINGARANILREFPELAGVVAGRTRNKGAARHGERGWGWRQREGCRAALAASGGDGVGGDVADGGADGMEVEW